MDTYYEAQLAAEGKDEWSEFLLLLDAAVMVSKEEDDIIELKKKNKTNSQQNHETLNGASTSSSLLDLNQAPTDSTTRDEYRRFISSSETKNPQNPRCSNEEEEERAKKGTFNLGRLESEKTETKNPPNPTYKSSPSSCLTESTSRKKREESSGAKSKKAKFGLLPRRMPREMPEWILQVIREMNGEENPMLIFETGLSASDVNQDQGRLLIPFNKLIRNDFLTPEECVALAKVAPTRREEDNYGLGSILVNQRSQKFGLRFKRYEMRKKSGLGTSNYALNYDWKYIVKENNLKEGTKIGLWTFKCRGILCFALETM